MSDLAVMEIVGSEPEAALVCAILRDSGIRCIHRVTNLGSGAMDGLTIGGPREIVVHRDELRRARQVIREQRDGPRPGLGAARDANSSRPRQHAFTGSAQCGEPHRVRSDDRPDREHVRHPGSTPQPPRTPVGAREHALVSVAADEQPQRGT